ncbi:gamma-glutamyl-gamma-aminobutyrate hydrolase family protein [Jeotgalibaca sp. A127]|uniref:gamma-glutamyl-gamma-aminobutyrate hydrolase family protein n=1 Tax=Jeotgalibaca sp. A127 TaxID=3457324 RepID=UPI003FD080D7
MKPIIGISGTQLLSATSEFEGTLVAYTPQFYIDTVQGAGATPIMLPVGTAEDARNMVEVLDALILSGGHDVDPELYGEEPHRNLTLTFPKRDAFDFALYEAAIEKGIPVLGVCRGLQLINVYHGGSLYQDLPAQYDAELLLHVQKAPFETPLHGISVQPGSHLYDVIGAHTKVNTLHHQAIKNLGTGLKAVAHSQDGIVEAIEPTDPNIDMIAVQWHPEIMAYSDPANKTLFKDFVARAEKVKTKIK